MKRFRSPAAALFAASLLAVTTPAMAAPPAQYGLIGHIVAQAGQREALAAVLLGASRGLPGCLHYVVAADPADPDALWVTEVWRDKAAHDASLTLPAVRAAIAQGRPLIAAMDQYHETRPIAMPEAAR